MVLPIIIRTTQESLKTVERQLPGSGAWSRVYKVLYDPYRDIAQCDAGIITGVILAIGRIVGESAALIFTSGIPQPCPKISLDILWNRALTLTIQLFTSAAKGENDVAFGIAAVLVIIVLVINLMTNKMNGRLKKH